MKLVLVDRDGVLNKERSGFVTSPEELSMLPQALEALALFRQKGFTCVVITNQSVVGRGIIPRVMLDTIHAHLCTAVAVHGGHIEKVIACTDHPDHATHRRKPGAGMIWEALHAFPTDPARTPFIGDSAVDMEAAHTAGCPRYLVMTGKGQETSRTLSAHLQPVTLCKDVLDAAQRIVTIF